MADRQLTFAIAEIFDSVQGEGTWVGERMTFVRMAGCNVGRRYTDQERKSDNAIAGLNVYQEKCTLWTGETFPCDTDYRAAMRLSIDEIMDNDDVRHAAHICLTGGEPLLQPGIELLMRRLAGDATLHIETSGTICLGKVPGQLDWIAVSPKLGVPNQATLERANEIKLLVTPVTTAELVLEHYRPYLNKVFLQPVNFEDSLNHANIEACLKLQRSLPGARISIQLHKVLRVR